MKKYYRNFSKHESFFVEDRTSVEYNTFQTETFPEHYEMLEYYEQIEWSLGAIELIDFSQEPWLTLDQLKPTNWPSHQDVVLRASDSFSGIEPRTKVYATNLYWASEMMNSLTATPIIQQQIADRYWYNFQYNGKWANIYITKALWDE